jgi:hypothetical protein
MMAVIRNECEVVMMLICSFVWLHFSSGSVVSFLGATPSSCAANVILISPPHDTRSSQAKHMIRLDTNTLGRSLVTAATNI